MGEVVAEHHPQLDTSSDGFGELWHDEAEALRDFERQDAEKRRRDEEMFAEIEREQKMN